MNKKKDLIVVGVLLAGALALHGLSVLLPEPDLSSKTADATLAPDAIEYVETPAPASVPTDTPTAKPTETPSAEPTDTPSAEPTEAPSAEATEAPTDTPDEEPAAFGPAPRPQTQEIRGHVVLTVGGRQYGDPIAMDRDKIITLKQDDGKVNKVHITPEKVYMEHSTCDNQDCVLQGEVSVDNYKKRVLTTWIICLPNNVSIEFIPAE